VIFATGAATHGLTPKCSSFDEGVKAALNDREWLDGRDAKANKVACGRRFVVNGAWSAIPPKGAGRHGRFRRKLPADADMLLRL
jgi:hypothetical protein